MMTAVTARKRGRDDDSSNGLEEMMAAVTIVCIFFVVVFCMLPLSNRMSLLLGMCSCEYIGVDVNV